VLAEFIIYLPAATEFGVGQSRGNAMKLREVSQNYDSAARYYDRLTDIVFGHILKLEKYRSHTIELLGDLDGAIVLDVGW